MTSIMSGNISLSSNQETMRLCPACDYDLRGIDSPHCPECGLPIGTVTAFSIPWEHRARMGRMTAYLRTARQATFRMTRFAGAAANPVDAISARRFRAIAAFLGALPVVLLLLGAMWQHGGTDFLAFQPMGFDLWERENFHVWEPVLLWSAGATLVPILPIAIFVAFWSAAKTTSIWFSSWRDHEQRERRLAISAYSSAPLTWLPISAVLLVGWAAKDPGEILTGPLWSFFFLLACAGIGVWMFVVAAEWWGTLRLLRLTTGCGWTRLIITGIGLPVGWILSAAIAIALVPCVAGLIWIAIDSLRK